MRLPIKWGFLVLSCLFFKLNAFGQTDTAQRIVQGRKNSISQQKKPYVILISADGFRYDYPEKYQTKHLQALGKAGVRAKSMLPSFPSVTFPNHYTIVTGLYPAHNGLVNNSFYDRDIKESYYYKSPLSVKSQWYGGKPLWVIAEEQQMLTASFYWVGSDVVINGITPTYYYKYNEKISLNDRI
jgi:predicted AlkP superfamily pyrophosphatase or phosphodiesterase